MTGFKKKNTLLDYYSEDVLCPDKENYREKNLEIELRKFSGVIEFVDSDEANFSLIAMTKHKKMI